MLYSTKWVKLRKPRPKTQPQHTTTNMHRCLLVNMQNPCNQANHDSIKKPLALHVYHKSHGAQIKSHGFQDAPTKGIQLRIPQRIPRPKESHKRSHIRGIPQRIPGRNPTGNPTKDPTSEGSHKESQVRGITQNTKTSSRSVCRHTIEISK